MWLGFVSFMLIKLMRYLGDKANGVLTLRVKANLKINVENLEGYIATKALEVSDAVSDTVAQTKKTVWLEVDRERWKGEPPKVRHALSTQRVFRANSLTCHDGVGGVPQVEVLYDETNAFLLVVLFQVNMRNTELAEDDLMPIFLDVLKVRVIA